MLGASNEGYRKVRNHGEGPYFSWLKAATTDFTFKTLLRHYAKQVLTPRSLNVKLGPRRKSQKGRAAIRHYANQTACPFLTFASQTQFHVERTMGSTPV